MQTCELPPRRYSVYANVIEVADGDVLVSVEK